MGGHVSEFTDGVLFLARDTDSLRQAAQDLSPAYPILSLNGKWEMLFPDRNAVKTTALLDWLQASSQQLPLMDFHNAEDIGWSYRLFKDGVEAASLDVNYDLDWNMMVAIFEKRHPGVDFYGSINPKILEETAAINQEVRKSKLFREKVAKQYQQKNLSEFSVFNVEPAVLAELDGILI
jgi:hypothetical protein